MAPVALTNGYAVPRSQVGANPPSRNNATGAGSTNAPTAATGYSAQSEFDAASPDAQQATAILAAFMANPEGLVDSKGEIVILSEEDVQALLSMGAIIPVDGSLTVSTVDAKGKQSNVTVNAQQLQGWQNQIQSSAVLNAIMQNPSVLGVDPATGKPAAIRASELSYLLGMGADIPKTGTITYTTSKGGTYQLKPDQLAKLQKGDKVEIKDSNGKKFELKLDKKTGEIQEKEKKGGFFSFITKPFTMAWDGIKAVGGFVKDHWRTILAAVAIGALAIGTMGAGLALAPAVLSAVSMAGTAANIALGVAGVVDGVKNGSVLQAIVGGASAFAGVSSIGAVARAVPAIAKGAQYANMAVQGAGAAAAAKRGDWLGVATAAASFGASYHNLPGLRNIDPNKLKQAAQATQAANGVNRAVRGGNPIALASAFMGAAALTADVVPNFNPDAAQRIDKYNEYAQTANRVAGGLGNGALGTVSALAGAAGFASTKIDGWGRATNTLNDISDYSRTAAQVSRAVKYKDVNSGLRAYNEIKDELRLRTQRPVPMALNMTTPPTLDGVFDGKVNPGSFRG